MFIVMRLTLTLELYLNGINIARYNIFIKVLIEGIILGDLTSKSFLCSIPLFHWTKKINF